MLRAGKLDREITIERETETVAPSGAVSKAWAPVATVRVELVQQSADEFLAGFGEAEGGNVVFRYPLPRRDHHGRPRELRR